MSEIKYFSASNANTFAEEIKRVFATKSTLSKLASALLLITDSVTELQDEMGDINAILENVLNVK